MSHHFETLCTDSVNNFSAFFGIGHFQLLLEEDGSLLVRGFDNSSNKEMVRWSGRGVQQRKEVDRLEKDAY